MPRSCSTPQTDWLRPLIWSGIYGEPRLVEGEWKPRPHITQRTYLARRNLRKFTPRLPGYLLESHFLDEPGGVTLYYFSDPSPSAAHALLNIDIDCHDGYGTPEGALKFAAHLQRLFKGLYCEASTHKVGQHGYLLLEKPDYPSTKVRGAFDHFEKWLQAEAAPFVAAGLISGAEVRGHPPVLVFNPHGELVDMTSGRFAKVPREAHRFKEWKGTAVLTPSEVLSLPIPSKSRQDAPESTNALADGQSPLLTPKRKPVGSCPTLKHVTEQQLEQLAVRERWFATQDIPAKVGELRLTPMDFAQATVVLEFLTLNPNPDGTLPHARIEALWKGLYDCKDFSRGFNTHRFQSIRDWLSSNGLLEWTDNTYRFGVDTDKGSACKWTLTSDFLHFLTELGLNQSPHNPPTHTHTQPLLQVKNSLHFLKPVPSGFRDSTSVDGIDWCEPDPEPVQWEPRDWCEPDPEPCWEPCDPAPPALVVREQPKTVPTDSEPDWDAVEPGGDCGDLWL